MEGRDNRRKQYFLAEKFVWGFDWWVMCRLSWKFNKAWLRLRLGKVHCWVQVVLDQANCWVFLSLFEWSVGWACQFLWSFSRSFLLWNTSSWVFWRFWQWICLRWWLVEWDLVVSKAINRRTLIETFILAALSSFFFSSIQYYNSVE